MSKKIAVVFPGQGSQSVGMLSTLAEEKIIKQTFAEANQALNWDIWRLIQEGPEEKLNQTEFTQPALLAASVALWRRCQSHAQFTPDFLAGHSLGEYSALVAAEALSFEDALKLVSKRGRYMQEAVSQGVGAMAAIVGLNDFQIIELCNESKLEGEILNPANYNSLGQTVIAGHATAIDRAIGVALSKGAKIAKRLQVSVPSHSLLMLPAATRFKQELDSIKIAKPKIPVIQNVDLQSHSSPNEIGHALVEQLTHPVRWVETIQFIEKSGVQLIMECGPGKVLAGLNKRISSQQTTYSSSEYELFAKAMLC
ncbi:MAG: ACP S-malonyltransferase [Proteobacteria bacterium]|nr:ACP S-malonyltransferase [Pseudomonadota bacterium]